MPESSILRFMRLPDFCTALGVTYDQAANSITEGLAADCIIRYAHEHQASLIALRAMVEVV